MRITNNMLINNMINYIGNNLTRMDKFQNQLATGKKISVPSDDPVVAARALKLRTDVAEVEQYKRNVKDAESWMEITEDALAKIGDVLQKTRELTVQGANGTLTTDDTQKINEEIKQLRKQLLHLGNSSYAGRYIFSGYKTDQKLLDETTGLFAIDVLNSENIKYEIGIGDDIEINVPGGDLFNDGGIADSTSPTPGKLIDDFDQLITSFDNGDHSAIGSLLTNLDADMNNVLRIRADIGARMNRVELTSNRLDSDYISFTKLMSENEDVDMAETIMNLQNEENVYRASLSGGARVIQPSLIDFLR
ncbi:MAG: flagellar hook-associated protein FlgL [Clostridiales bacterium GWC2_40_7]|nr:MAG: flagellar hook-associated protein FlgL [Clostridiales bacterium GWC2_40_7]